MINVSLVTFYDKIISLRNIHMLNQLPKKFHVRRWRLFLVQIIVAIWNSNLKIPSKECNVQKNLAKEAISDLWMWKKSCCDLFLPYARLDLSVANFWCTVQTNRLFVESLKKGKMSLDASSIYKKRILRGWFWKFLKFFPPCSMDCWWCTFIPKHSKGFLNNSVLS